MSYSLYDKTEIITTVLRWNYKDIPLLIDEVVKNKADIFSFARYIRLNRIGTPAVPRMNIMI